MKAQAKKKSRKLTWLWKWAIIMIPLIAIVTWGIIFVLQSSHNPAKQEAKRALGGFTDVISGRWYCENGAPKGIDNHTPWWEEIYVSQTPIDDTTEGIAAHLADQGYRVEKQYIEDSQDNSNQDKTYWEVGGIREQFEVKGRIIAHDITLNNCFPKFSNVDETIDPKDYASVVVIHFTGNSQ